METDLLTPVCAIWLKAPEKASESTKLLMLQEKVGNTHKTNPFKD